MTFHYWYSPIGAHQARFLDSLYFFLYWVRIGDYVLVAADDLHQVGTVLECILDTNIPYSIQAFLYNIQEYSYSIPFIVKENKSLNAVVIVFYRCINLPTFKNIY